MKFLFNVNAALQIFNRIDYMLLNRRISVFYFINLIKWQIVLICIFAVTIGILDCRVSLRPISLPLNIPTIIGTAVSLLLAFRTAQSYDRWWEARIVWGAIVNDSRSLVRLSLQFMSKEEALLFAKRQIIWVNALTASLRKTAQNDMVKEFLAKEQIVAVNIPNAILDKHSEQIASLVGETKLNEFQQMQLNELITRLCDSMGKCERIKNTVFPKSYSILLHVLIYVFAFTLPFGLDNDRIAAEIAITIIVPVVFVAIEKTAILMQDPFENRPTDTPMSSISQTIEINIRQMIGDKNVPEKKDNGLYYEM